MVNSTQSAHAEEAGVVSHIHRINDRLHDPAPAPASSTVTAPNRDEAYVLQQLAEANVEHDVSVASVNVVATGMDAIPMRVSYRYADGISMDWHMAHSIPQAVGGHVWMIATYKRGQFVRGAFHDPLAPARPTRYGVDDEVHA